MRASMDVDVPLACKLDVVAGPCTNASYTNTEDVLEVRGCACVPVFVCVCVCVCEGETQPHCRRSLVQGAS